MALVNNSLTLDNIIILVKNNKRDFWFVTRSGTVKKLFISTELANHTFVREHELKIKVHNLNTNKSVVENWTETYEGRNKIGGSGHFYDHYYSKGHFFDNQSDAFKYLVLRIKTRPKNLVKTASQLLEDYPEYLI